MSTAYRPALVLAALLACKTAAPTRPPETATATATATTATDTALAITADGAEVRPPAFELTASDGTGLRLAALEVRAVVQGPLALTQLRLVFVNPQPRPIEGRFAVTLPEGAAISRFAMKIAGRWQEGEVVERLAAAQVYESFLHVRVDPALLEHDAGGRFRARVFPILAHERKELILTYSQELTRADEYRVPLLGLPQLDALDVAVLLPGDDARVLHRADHVPDGDLVVRVDPTRPAGVRSGSLVAARVDLVADAAATSTTSAAGWTILLDTSASQAIGFAARVRRLKPLLAALAAREGRDVAVTLIGFDQEQVRLYSGPASGFGDPQIQAVIDRGALGATAPAAALRLAARAGARVVLVSDGIATLGASTTAVRTATGAPRVDALVAGSTADRAALRAATSPAGVVLDESRPPDVIVDRLRAPVLRDVAVEVAGSRWTLPARLDGVQPGDSVLVYAEVDDPGPLRVQFKGAPLRAQQIATTAVERPLLERSWRGAQLRELVAQHARLADKDDRRAALRAQIVDLSLKHRVQSPFTALLVLETEDDYRRFGLDRRALSDVLVVGDAGVEVLTRDRDGVLAQARAATKNPGESATPLVAGEQVRDLDTDRDGVTDSRDACPDRPEDLDGVEDEDGCPDLLLFDNCQIKLTDKIHFKPGSATIDKASHKLLADIRDTFNAAPDIRTWVDGHTDSKGTDKANKALSQRRVDAVVQHLVAQGIAPERLAPRGMGESVPIADNKTADGRAANRRVEFNLTDCNRGRFWSPPSAPPEQALAGRLRGVAEALTRGPAEGLQLARAWWSEQPGDALAALALGQALAASGQPAAALRAFGSLVDLAPSRAEYRRHAGQRFEALGATELAVDTYREAVGLRPDHPHGHRLLAFALVRLGRHAEAFAALERGRAQRSAWERFPGLDEILADDLAVLGAAWVRSDPAARPEVERRLAAIRRTVADHPSIRFVLTWEVDAANVDLFVEHPHGLRSHDLGVFIRNNRGYGPEMLRVTSSERDYPYKVRVQYSWRAAMGDAMGAVHVLEHDGHGRLGSVILPFVLMSDRTAVDVGEVAGPLIAD